MDSSLHHLGFHSSPPGNQLIASISEPETEFRTKNPLNRSKQRTRSIFIKFISVISVSSCVDFFSCLLLLTSETKTVSESATATPSGQLGCFFVQEVHDSFNRR